LHNSKQSVKKHQGETSPQGWQLDWADSKGKQQGDSSSAKKLCSQLRRVMNVFDLIKATIACGLSAFLIYSFPVVSQVLIIGLLSLLWLSYAHKTFATLLRR
jgi:hypothetical protein